MIKHRYGAGTISRARFILRPSYRDHKDALWHPRRRRGWTRGHLAIGFLIAGGSIATTLALRAPDSVASIPDTQAAGEASLAVTRSPLDSASLQPEFSSDDVFASDSDDGSRRDQQARSPRLTPDAEGQRYIVAPGDNLYLVLTRMGLTPATVAAVMDAAGDTRPLRNLRPRRELHVRVRGDILEALRYEIDPLASMQVVRTGEGYRAQIIEQPSQQVQRVVHGTIENSLYLSAQLAGLADPMILALADLFGWDIDFTMDLQPGDRFSVVFEEVHSGGLKVRDGAILAAEFVNRGRVLRAVRYTDAAGESAYYTPEGRSLRKAFSRNPLPVTRITSRFNPNRLHPIFRTRRPHRGVDYGAPTGTPVRATGDGTVAYAGRKGGYGNALILQHGKSYRTLYGHLSRFAPGMRSGRRVRQGELIAFVGATGWATGPHLHYEFQVNGVHKDPLRVALPPAPEVPAAELARFRALASPTLAALDVVAATYQASR